MESAEQKPKPHGGELMAERVGKGKLGPGGLDPLDTEDIRGGIPSRDSMTATPASPMIVAPPGWIAYCLRGGLFVKTNHCDQPGTVLVRDEGNLPPSAVHQDLFEKGAYHPHTLKKLTGDDIRRIFGMMD